MQSFFFFPDYITITIVASKFCFTGGQPKLLNVPAILQGDDLQPTEQMKHKTKLRSPIPLFNRPYI